MEAVLSTVTRPELQNCVIFLELYYELKEHHQRTTDINIYKPISYS